MHYYRSTHVSFFCLEILENGPSGSKHVADWLMVINGVSLHALYFADV